MHGIKYAGMLLLICLLFAKLPLPVCAAGEGESVETVQEEVQEESSALSRALSNALLAMSVAFSLNFALVLLYNRKDKAEGAIALNVRCAEFKINEPEMKRD